MNIWQKATIVLFAVLIAQLITSEVAYFTIAGSLILLLGIPHGASDPLIFNFLNHKKFRTDTSRSFLAIYFTLIGIYLLFWILFPKISFLAFLVISSGIFSANATAQCPNHALRLLFISVKLFSQLIGNSIN